ncbi:MAG: alpha/beta hydrolase, partial [Microbacterium sp.]
PLNRAGLKGLPKPVLDAAVEASSTVTAARTAAAEYAQVAAGIERLRADPPALGDIGVSVISGQRTTIVDRGIRGRLVAAHRETARQHENARRVAAERSGHLVPVTEPDLIAAEALSFLG